MSFSNQFEADILGLIFNATAISGLADNASASPLTNLYVALHTADIGEGGNPAGNATVLTDSRSYEYEVAGAIAGPGTPVYLTARAGATAPILSITVSGAVWGYTVPKVGETGVRAAGSGKVIVRPAQV